MALLQDGAPGRRVGVPRSSAVLGVQTSPDLGGPCCSPRTPRSRAGSGGRGRGLGPLLAGSGVPWVSRPALQAEQNKLLHRPGHRGRGGHPMGVPWASAQSPDRLGEWRAPAKHPGVGPRLRLGASGCSGCPPRPLSHHTPDTGPLLLKPRRLAILRGALLKGLEVWLRIGAPGSGSPPPGRGAQRPCAPAQRSRKAASWAGRSSGHGAGVVPCPPPSTGSRGHWLWCLRKRNKQTFNLEKPRTKPDLCAEPSGSE